MTIRPTSPAGTDITAEHLDVAAAAAMSRQDVLDRLRASGEGLAAADASRRLRAMGPNAVRSHHARLIQVLLRQFRSPLLVLLAVTAVASYFVGERSDALIIALILAASVGLGCLNEYRAEKATEALHSQIEHRCVVRRDDRSLSIDVTVLVPGDVVELRLGEVVPADIRLLETTGPECNEAV
jgi:Mg2+-importing ATPase